MQPSEILSMIWLRKPAFILSQSKSRFCNRKFDFLFHWRSNQYKIAIRTIYIRMWIVLIGISIWFEMFVPFSRNSLDPDGEVQGCVPLSQSKSRFCDRKFNFLFHWRANQSKIGDQSFFRCSFQLARKSNQSRLSKSKKRLAKRNATIVGWLF